MQTQATADLLLEQHRTLRGTQQQQRVHEGKIHPFVIEIAGDDGIDLAPGQSFRRCTPILCRTVSHHTLGRNPGSIEPARHEPGMAHRHTEDQGPALGQAACQTLPFMDDHACPHVVSRHKAVNGGRFSRRVPRHRREIRLVVASVVLERTQQLQIQCLPKSKLDGRRTIPTVLEVPQNGLPITALGRGRQPQQHGRPDGVRQRIEAVGCQAMAFINDHRVPVIGTETIDQSP